MRWRRGCLRISGRLDFPARRREKAKDNAETLSSPRVDEKALMFWGFVGPLDATRLVFLAAWGLGVILFALRSHAKAQR